MDAFVIQFMTTSFYYFLRLAYKTQEGNWNGRKEVLQRKERIRESIFSRTLENRQTLPWLMCSFVIHG